MERWLSSRRVALGGGVLALLALVGAACVLPPPARLEGQVVDVLGEPMLAKVQVVGTTLSTWTDEDGRWALPYYPGSFDVLVEAEGHCPAAQALTLTQAARVELAPFELTPIPRRVGLWRYAPLWSPRDVRAAAWERDALGALQLLEPATRICKGEALVLRGCGARPDVAAAGVSGHVLPPDAQQELPEVEEICPDVWRVSTPPGVWLIQNRGLRAAEADCEALTFISVEGCKP